MQTSPTRFSPTGSVSITGTKSAGSSVVVSLAGGTTLCEVPATPSISWSCASVALSDGARIRLEARETPGDPRAMVPASASVTIDSLTPPTMDGPSDQLTTGIVSGSGRPGAQVAVSVDGVPDPSCASVAVGSDSAWSCNLAVTGGAPRLVRAQQSDAGIGGGSRSAYSNAITVTVDREPAAAPVIGSPSSGGTVGMGNLVVSGSGEDAASIDLYLDNVPACAAVVSGTTWSCTVGGLLPGDHDLQAVQRDEAGNFSSPSSAVRITVKTTATSAPLIPTPSPSTTPRGTPKPATPKPAPSEPAAPSAPTQPSPDASGVPPITSGPQPPSPPAGNWGAPTEFGSTLTSFTNPSSFSKWYTAPLLALVFLSLVAIPLRLLVTTLRDRLPSGRPRVTGRNQFAARPSASEPIATVPSLWRRMLLPIAATAVLVIFTGGIDGEVRYARLLIAVAIGLTVLNVVGGALGARLGGSISGQPTILRFVPLMFVAAAATAILSRMLGIDPPLVAGVLVAPAFAMGVAVRSRAVVNIVQVASILGLGVLGWIGHGMLMNAGITAAGGSPATGLWPAIASESLATLCLAGLGSALVMVLPIASLPGRVILEWSPLAWVTTVLLVVSVAASITVSASLSASILPVILGALGFAAVSVAVWAWVRYVEPATA